MNQFLLKTEINGEDDIVLARKRCREFSQYLKLDKQEQTRLATAVSEMARNVFQYARAGTIDYNFSIEKEKGWIVIVIRDLGPGIKNLDEILSGQYKSPEGMGIGILGSRKLMDDFSIKTSPEGTVVTLKKIVPLRKFALTPKEIKEILDILIVSKNISPHQEIQRQNEEILLTIAELNDKKEELARLNRELEQTNRGVVALYAELDEKAESLRIANETKTSFLSDLTHEFRSPVNSILSISRLLLEEAVEEKNVDRQKQINFIIKAGQGLSDLVNDLLDIAKIEAGKTTVKVANFTVEDLFGTMKGLMRPVNINPKVNLVFEDLTDNQPMSTDEGKINQMLRNIISNAIKYTEEGEIKVTATFSQENQSFEFCVSDTGIGIAEEHLEAIFNEFVQVSNPLQKKSKGTGLGLPLTKKLASLLGGSVSVTSTPDVGSTFKIVIPALYKGESEVTYQNVTPDQSQAPKEKIEKTATIQNILIIDDDEQSRAMLKKIAEQKGLNTRLAKDGRAGLEMARVWHPDLIILDLVMPVMGGLEFIKNIMIETHLRNVPVILNTSQDLSPEEYLYLEQVTDRVVKKDDYNDRIISKILDEMMKS